MLLVVLLFLLRRVYPVAPRVLASCCRCCLVNTFCRLWLQAKEKESPPPSPLSSLEKKRRGSEEKQEPEQKKNGSSCKFLFVLRRVSYDRKNMRMAIVPFWAL